MRPRVVLCVVLAVVAAASTGAADRPWRLLKGTNVIVVGPQSPKTLRGIAVQIEGFRAIVGRFLRGADEPTSLPTTVYVFDDQRAIRPFVPLFEGKPISLGGYCHCGTGPTAVSFIALDISAFRASSALIFHEYAHLLVHNAVSVVPAWLSEGLAEYYSTFELTDDRHASLGRPIPRHVLLLRERVVPLSDLLAIDHTSREYNEGDRRGIFYAESWALTHYLMNERAGGVAGINRYLGAAQAGDGDANAFAAAFGVTPAQMERELRGYVGRQLFRSTAVTLAEGIAIDEPEAARPLADADTEARLGEIQRRIGRVDEAAPRIEKAAAAGPDEAQAQLALAFLRLAQGRAAEAGPALRRAAALAPSDFVTQYTFALALLRADVPGGATGEDPRELAHDALLKAVAINPRSAEALSWLAYADLARGQALAEALNAITKAIEIAPGRLDYRLRQAEIFVRYDAVADAKRVLSALTTAPDEDIATRAHDLLDRITAAERRAAQRADIERDRIAAGVPDAGVPGPPRRAVEVPDASARKESEPGTRFVMRKVRPGEERAYGYLTEVSCGPGGVEFHLRVGARVVVAVAKAMGTVELTTFGNDKEFMLACGERKPPDTVYMTWKSGPHRPVGTATIVGDAVAVEFVPPGYVP